MLSYYHFAVSVAEFLLLYVALVVGVQTWTTRSWRRRQHHAGSGRMRSTRCWRTTQSSKSFHSLSTSLRVCIPAFAINPGPEPAESYISACLLSVTECLTWYGYCRRGQNRGVRYSIWVSDESLGIGWSNADVHNRLDESMISIWELEHLWGQFDPLKSQFSWFFFHAQEACGVIDPIFPAIWECPLLWF
jgi:hypothetical protein